MTPKKEKLRIHDNSEQTRLNVYEGLDTKAAINAVIILANTPTNAIEEALEKIESHSYKDKEGARETIAEIIMILKTIKEKRANGDQD